MKLNILRTFEPARPHLSNWSDSPAHWLGSLTGTVQAIQIQALTVPVFVTYVFNHFDIRVPRITPDFMPVHQQILLKDAKLGDLILFTGTDSTQRIAGHMGIISSLPG